MFKRNLVPLFLITLYVLLFLWQINQPTFERYPNWDIFWGPTLMAGKLLALKDALVQGELPAINPYVGFGWNLLGDTTLPQSPLNPLNALILFLSPEVVIMIRAALLMILGGLAASLYLRFITGDRLMSLIGGLMYISLPITISMNLYYNVLNIFYLLPFFLLLVHLLLERVTARRLLLLTLLSVFAFACGDVFVLVILPPVIGFYTFVIALTVARLTFVRSMTFAAGLTTICLLTGSFYILPLYTNLHEISQTSDALREAGILGSASAMSVETFLSFVRINGIETLYKPNEGSGMLLYAPVCFYFVIAVAFLLKRRVFKDNPRQAAISFALVALGLVMFLIPLVFYSLPPSLAGAGKGVLRYHLNLIPFVVVLAGFVCFAAINQAEDIRRRIYLLILSGSFVTDWLLFGVSRYLHGHRLFYINHVTVRGFESSNVMPVRFWADMWLFLPWLNFTFVVLVFLAGGITLMKPSTRRRISSGSLAAAAFLLCLLGISVHNELRATQQTQWQMVTRDSYRWESYLKRRNEIDGLIDRRDLNYRTLPAGTNIWGNSGRNWKFIAETELSIQNHEKILFSYRETMHPYAGLLYSTFLPNECRLSNWMPPLSSSVPGNIPILRLMGVRRVLSADEFIDSPDLIYKGECVSDKAPPFAGPAADGKVYVYELRNPLGIAFLTEDYELLSRTEALKRLFRKTDEPWTRGVVYLESEPITESALSGEPAIKRARPQLQASAKIVGETFNSVRVNVSAPASRFLVLSYIFRPNWRAYLNGDELRVYRAYGGFMAVQVPAGQHTIMFRYTPKDVYLGLALTALALGIPFLATAARPFRKPAVVDLKV